MFFAATGYGASLDEVPGKAAASSIMAPGSEITAKPKHRLKAVGRRMCEASTMLRLLTINWKKMNELTEYAKRLAALTNDQLIDERYASLLAHKNSTEGARDLAFLKTQQTEAAMITRFGLREAHKVFAAKYPNPPSF
jgi:hypothetical protein